MDSLLAHPDRAVLPSLVLSALFAPWERISLLLVLLLLAHGEPETSNATQEAYFTRDTSCFTQGFHDLNRSFHRSYEPPMKGPAGTSCARKWKPWVWKTTSPDPRCSTLVDSMQGYLQDQMLACNALGTTSLLFVGDSVQDSQFVSMASLLGARGFQEHNDFGTKALPVCRGRSRIQFLRNGGLVEPYIPHGSQAHRKLPSHANQAFLAISRKYDVLVMNTGSHYRPDDSHFNRTVELGTGLLKNGFGDERNKLFVWRTTAMGHEGCKNISAPLPAPPPPYKSNTSFKYHWPLFEHQNSIAINTLRQCTSPSYVCCICWI